MLIFMHMYNALLLQCGHHQSPLLQVGTDPESEPCFKKFKYLSSVVSERLKERHLSATPTDSPQEEQLQLYLSDMKVPQEEIDAIDFWVANKARFPDIAPVALDVLVIPASSTPIERVFSSTGLVTAGRRCRLSAKQLEREILIKKNKCFL